MKLTAKILKKCVAITKTDGQSVFWLVGYREVRNSRSKKTAREHWLTTPQRMTPKISMQCVNCRFAPHNLPTEELAQFTRDNLTVGKQPQWCSRMQHYQEERCTEFILTQTVADTSTP